MKKEVYVCDNCKQVIYTGVILRGVLTGIGFQDIIGIIAGGKEEDEYHYCYSCIACLTRTFKLPNKQTTRYPSFEWD